MKKEDMERLFYLIFFVCLISFVIITSILLRKNIGVCKTVEKLTFETKILYEKIDELQNKLQKYNLLKTVTVSAYNPHTNQCDDTPYTTAIMEKVKPGIVAVSRDLWESGWTFGKKIYIEDLGVFRIADFMNKRYVASIDIFMWDKKEALKFGIKTKKACLILDENK